LSDLPRPSLQKAEALNHGAGYLTSSLAEIRMCPSSV
jgi:hypothetical protein